MSKNKYYGFSVIRSAKNNKTIQKIENEQSSLYFQYHDLNSKINQNSSLCNNQIYNFNLYYPYDSYFNNTVLQPIMINQTCDTSAYVETSTDKLLTRDRPPSPPDQQPSCKIILNSPLVSDFYDLNKLYFKSGTNLSLSEINLYSFYLLNLEPDEVFSIDEYNNIYLLEFNKEIDLEQMNRNILTIQENWPIDLKCEFINKNEFIDKIKIQNSLYLKIIFKNNNITKWKNELMNNLFKNNMIVTFNNNYLLIRIRDNESNDLAYAEWKNCIRQTMNKYFKRFVLIKMKFKESSLPKINDLMGQVDLMSEKKPCVVDYYLDLANKNIWFLGLQDDIENFMKINDIVDNDRESLISKAIKLTKDKIESVKNENINDAESKDSYINLIQKLTKEQEQNENQINDSLNFLNQLILNNVSKRLLDFELQDNNDHKIIKKRKLIDQA